MNDQNHEKRKEEFEKLKESMSYRISINRKGFLKRGAVIT